MEPFYGLSEEEMSTILFHFPNKLYLRNIANEIIFENGETIAYTDEKGNNISKEAIFLGCKDAWTAYRDAFLQQDKDPFVIELCVHGERLLLVNRKLHSENGDVFYLTIVQHCLKHIEFKIDDLPNQDHPFIVQSKASAPILTNTRSTGFKKTLQICKLSAKSQMPILIQGQSGTGKTMLAKYIHENSLRKKEPFLSINCASIPKDLLESELFGYLPHSFTGANDKGKIGLIEVANKGTLFLDEIGEMPLSLQAKILTFVETKRFLPIGAIQEKTVDVRIVSATNRPLPEMIRERLFREDLFWRLNHIPVTMPNLSDRQEDILPLANYFLNQNNKKNNTNLYIDLQAQNFLYAYTWPGNIRELKNMLESAFAYCNGSCITLSDLQKSDAHETTNHKESLQLGFKEEMKRRECELIKEYYAKYPSSRKLASALEISQSLANKLIHEYIETE